MNRLNKNVSMSLLPLFLLLAWAVQASDQLDSPSAANDPIADITQLYAFMNPACRVRGGTGCEAAPEELILALTVNPSATEATQFSDGVVYHIYCTGW
jgi:hypothetical protein